MFSLKKLLRSKNRTLDALRESEEKYRVFIEYAHDGIMHIINLRPVYANKRMISMVGYTEEEFFRHGLLDFFPDSPLGKNLVSNYYTNRMQGNKVPSQYHAQMLTVSGEIIDVIISAAMVTIDGEKGSIVIVTNISDLMKAERTILKQYERIESQYSELRMLNDALLRTQAELIEAHGSIKGEKEQLAVTLGSIGDAVISLDRNARVVLCNSVAEQLTGYTTQQASGKHIGEVLVLLKREHQEVFADPFSRLSPPPERLLIDEPVVLFDSANGRRLVEINGAPVRRGNEIEGMVLAIRDITEKYRLEQELLKMSKLESLGVLAGGIAHDFNNLLTAIMGNVSIARTIAGDNPRLVKIIDKLDNACERAANLTRQLLTFSKGGEPIRKTSSIVDLLRETANFIVSGSNVKTEFALPDDIWPVDIDTDQMSQVANNLIINALQSMPDGGNIRIMARNLPEAPAELLLQPGRYVMIAIEDDGCGIPEEDLGRIFDPYFTTKRSGSGLGLTSCYSIISKHDGAIRVSSKVGVGTVFSIYLKASEHAIEKKACDDSTVRSHTGRVLVMDDEDFIRDVARQMLESLGYAVELAKDGVEAIERYERAREAGKPFDVVIMDLTIPGGMGGEEAIRKLLPRNPGIRAVVTSGYSDNPVLAHHEEYGFRGALLKPFKMNDIAKVLDAVLTEKEC